MTDIEKILEILKKMYNINQLERSECRRNTEQYILCSVKMRLINCSIDDISYLDKIKIEK